MLSGNASAEIRARLCELVLGQLVIKRPAADVPSSRAASERLFWVAFMQAVMALFSACSTACFKFMTGVSSGPAMGALRDTNSHR